MKKINNPFAEREGHSCFGCSPINDHGLKMEFYDDEENDEIFCEWTPKDCYQSFPNILHGGIQTTLLDEIASRVLFIKLKTGGYTVKMEIKLKKHVRTDNGNIIIRARIREQKRNMVFIEGKIFDKDNNLCTLADIVYFALPIEQAKNEQHFPEYNKFFS